jgi:DNA-binding NarL/FixJ family response regulator
MNLVIVEDNELVLYQLLRLVAKQPGIRVAGLASEEDAAVKVICLEAPDAVLLDLSLAAGSGINVLKRIRAAGSTARVLVLTNQTADIARRSCDSHGIEGFYDKSREFQTCLDHLFSWLPQLRGETQ